MIRTNSDDIQIAVPGQEKLLNSFQARKCKCNIKALYLKLKNFIKSKRVRNLAIGIILFSIVSALIILSFVLPIKWININHSSHSGNSSNSTSNSTSDLDDIWPTINTIKSKTASMLLPDLTLSPSPVVLPSSTLLASLIKPSSTLIKSLSLNSTPS